MKVKSKHSGDVRQGRRASRARPGSCLHRKHNLHDALELDLDVLRGTLAPIPNVLRRRTPATLATLALFLCSHEQEVTRFSLCTLRRVLINSLSHVRCRANRTLGRHRRMTEADVLHKCGTARRATSAEAAHRAMGVHCRSAPMINGPVYAVLSSAVAASRSYTPR